MFPYGGFDSDKKDEMAAAAQKEFKQTKSALMKRLQYYQETGKESEMNYEIAEIKFYLDVIEDEFMVETHGVTQLNNFLSKIYEIDYKHPIPADWIPKTPTAPCSAAYDPCADWDDETRERFEKYKETEGKDQWVESTTFSSRPSRNFSRGNQHHNSRRCPRPAAASSGSTTIPDRSESGSHRREWYDEAPEDSRARPSSSKAASGNSTQGTEAQPSNELPDWLRNDDNSREDFHYDRTVSQPLREEEPSSNAGESHWLNDSPLQTSAQRESTPPAHYFYVLNAPPRPHFPSGPTSTYVPQQAAPILHIQNIGPNSITNIFNVPPPSLNQHANNSSRNPPRRRSRSPIRPTSYRPLSGFSARPETQRMNTARNYERGQRKRTDRNPPPRYRDISSTSAHRQQRNNDVPNYMDGDRKHISKRSHDYESDRSSSSRDRQSSTSQSVRRRIQSEARNEGLYRLGQRVKKLEKTQKQIKKGSSTDKPSGTASSGSESDACKEVGGRKEKVGICKKIDRTQGGVQKDTQLERNTNERDEEVESIEVNGKVKASKERREAELGKSIGKMTANKKRREEEASESHAVAEPDERCGEMGANDVQRETESSERNGALLEATNVQKEVESVERSVELVEANDMQRLSESDEINKDLMEANKEKELNSENQVCSNLNDENGELESNGTLVDKPVPFENQSEKNPLKDNNGAENILQPVASTKDVQPNHDESSVADNFITENETENSQTTQLQSVGYNDNSDRDAELETAELQPIAGPSTQQKSKTSCNAHLSANPISAVEDNTNPAESESLPRYNLRSLKRKLYKSSEELIIISTKSLKPGEKESRKSNAPTGSQPGPSSETAEEIRIQNVWEKSIQKFTTQFTKSGNTFVGKAAFACNVGLGKIKTEGDYIPPPPTLKKEKDYETEVDVDDYDPIPIIPDVILKVENDFTLQFEPDLSQNEDAVGDKEEFK